jgi:predicted N-acetyltransferase YhbS
MTNTTLSLGPLTEPELAEAGAVLDAAFGRRSMTGNLRAAHALQPESWFRARRNGRLVALVGAHDYGPFCCIGMMAVHPAEQRQRIGERLLAHLLGQLKAPVALLDASAAGQRLYPRLGFIPEGETLRFNLTHAPDVLAAPSVFPLTETDLAAVAAFDAPVFGADRLAVLRAFRQTAPARAWLARDEGGAIAGYLFSNDSHIGPWCAATPDAAAQLLSAALAQPWRVPPMLTCPSENLAAAGLLARQGFTVTERLLHMRRGGTTDPRQTVYLYGQASLTLG